MRYLTFGTEEKSSYKICILVNDIRKDEIQKLYIKPYDLNEEDIIVISLHQNKTKKKTPAVEQKAYIIEELLPVLQNLQVEYLIVGDGDYFKTLTKSPKVDAVLGYVLDTDSAYGEFKVVYVPNYRTVFYDPIKVTEKIALGINALKSWFDGSYQAPGVTIIYFADYPDTQEKIIVWLQKLFMMPALAIDIEGFSLKHYDAGLGTISFAWNKHEGIAFPIDLIRDHKAVREVLRQFFEAYQGKLIFHNIAYDAYVMIYELFMEHLLDNEGLLYGLSVILRDWECTKLISYLATNSCAGNKLSLKDQAQAFAGNYAVEEIKDIRKIPLPQLLQYNLVDALSTWYVYEKHYQTVIDDNQLDVYENLFKPATVDIIQMQLTGMPIDMERVGEVKTLLQKDNDDAIAIMSAGSIVQRFNYSLLEAYTNKKNSEWVNKRMTILEMEEHARNHEPTRETVTFNPNSGPQLQKLLFEDLGLPVISRTETKLPKTDGDTLKALKHHTKDPAILEFLEALSNYKAVEKILSSFIPAMEGAQQGNDGWHYLFGNFNLGGTVSGRLSSSDPNLQNIPSNSRYAKLIKSCFVAPPGWFFCGIDFASLEDRISALTTKDPNKLKVYTDGYDGHSLRAFAYFGENMPDIEDNVQSINSIQEKYKPFRQDSKVPTFLLTYGGTYMGLMEKAGFPRDKAKMVEARYHELYKVSDDWVASKLEQASKDGYVTVAFGLRVRTPLLKQVVIGTSKTPYEASAEGRTAGNALGQSWCLLNSRAGSEFMGKVRQSQYRHDIKPCAQIHDAQYFLVKDNVETIFYANKHVVQACEWQDHPEIEHPDVKLGGEFSIFYPHWGSEIILPNGASEETIIEVFQNKLSTKK